MEIKREDFERAVELAYRRGCVRPTGEYISPEDVRNVISGLYDMKTLETCTAPDKKTPVNSTGLVEKTET